MRAANDNGLRGMPPANSNERHHFPCIVADPPWKFGDSLPGTKRGASKHYKTLTLPEIICHAPYATLAMAPPDCIMFLWRVAAMQREALDLAAAWGFVVKSELVWEKTTKTGKDHFGMGHYVRASHETCLICVRGKPKVLDHSIRSRFRAPVQKHSQKPDLFYEIVEKLTPGPRLELFARRHRQGWFCLGDELRPAGRLVRA